MRRYEPGRGLIKQHRAVMRDILDRELYSWEEVHHKNGIRHDNEPGNLELWIRRHPHGQRVEDLIAWAVTHYRNEVAALVAT